MENKIFKKKLSTFMENDNLQIPKSVLSAIESNTSALTVENQSSESIIEPKDDLSEKQQLLLKIEMLKQENAK